VPEVGLVVVGGLNDDNERLSTAELLTGGGGSSSTEDNGDVNWSWRQLPAMLWDRKWPAVAHFGGHVVVAGGTDDDDIVVESLRLPAGDSGPGQWMQISRLDGYIGWSPSLALYNGRLLLLGRTPLCGGDTNTD
uniref:F-box/kelch-repeat protein n=1 Tax=Mesocestoides corti TaxID=53468 RepID=A0A5K3G7G3_MESCO